MASKRTVAPKTVNRVILWQSVLKTAYEAMLADEVIWKILANLDNIQSDEYNKRYDTGLVKGAIYVPAAAHGALQGEAVVLFGQVFTSGSAGPGIADNNWPEVVTLRTEMEAYVKNILGWDDAKYKSAFDAIMDRRHQLLAHYDGSKAEYDEPAPGVQRMRSPRINFPFDQVRKDVIALIRVMYEFVQSDLLPSFSD